MNPSTLDTIALRLDRLERENQRLKMLGCGLLLLLFLIVMVGATGETVPEEIVAKRFVVVDDEGRPRIWMGISPGGFADLSLRDPKGVGRLELSVYPNGSSSLVVLGQGYEKINLHAGPSFGGNPGIILWGKEQGNGILMEVNERGPHIGLEDAANRTAILGIGKKGPSLELKGSGGYPRIVLGSLTMANPQTGSELNWPVSLTFFDKEGGLIWAAPVN